MFCDVAPSRVTTCDSKVKQLHEHRRAGESRLLCSAEGAQWHGQSEVFLIPRNGVRETADS